MVHFDEFLKTWSLQLNSVTRQVTVNGTEIGEKWQIQMRHFGWFSNNMRWPPWPQRLLEVNFDFLGDYNILSVDYGPLAECFPYYGVAVANIKKVGPYVGQLLGFMVENLQLSANNVHLVGWSLGGQLVAFIGQEMNGTLSRITSLDPAGLYFLVFSGCSRTTRWAKKVERTVA